MENENQQEVQPQEPHGDEPDYKALYEKTLAESRKWEERSKANKKQLDALAAKGGDEDVSERLTELSDKLRELEAERDKLQHQTNLRTWADEVAAERASWLDQGGDAAARGGTGRRWVLRQVRARRGRAARHPRNHT